MNEEWRDIPGWNGLYKVSSQGRVMSFTRKCPGGKILKHAISRGYPRVSLRAAGRNQSKFVHGLVAAAFLGPKPIGLEVCHNDHNKLNNTPENLRYGTRSENMRDIVRAGYHHLSIRTHCPEGHPYDEANTYHRNDKPARGCKTCRAAAAVRYQQRKVAA